MTLNGKKVIAHTSGGLGNRLSTLINAFYLAERFNLSILLDWPTDNQCECNFHDLFENEIDMVESPNGLHRKEYYKSKLKGPIYYFGKRLSNIPDVSGEVILPQRESDFCTGTNIVYDSPTILGFINQKNRSRLLKNLKIKKNILLNVEEFCRQYNINQQVYGVHIRQTDAAVRDLNYFTVKMDAIIASNPLARFFICSDSEYAEKTIQEMYPDRVIHKAKSNYVKKKNAEQDWLIKEEGKGPIYNVYRDSQSVIEALIDILILTRTTFSIRSNGTFSNIVEWWVPEFHQVCQYWKKYKFKANTLIKNTPNNNNRLTLIDRYLKFYQAVQPNYMKTQLAPMPQYGKGKEGISIITACRNRSENLKASLESWLQCEDVAEIIIVDWASTEPVSSWLFECVDDRVKLISVTNIHRWTLTHAFNLAACFADYKQLCKMDADYEIESDFFKHHQLKPGLFYSGAGVKTSDENEKHLNGLVFLEHEKFFSLNGFNERIITYGWDDSDLNERLKESGLRKKVIDKKYVQHLRHSDYQRGRYKRKFPNLKRFIQGNRKHARKKPWGEGDRVIKYACSKIDTQHYSSTPIVVNQNDSRPKLFIHVEHGLGSRLAAIASGMALAIQLKREFHLVWEQSTHCECDFVDLFDSQWPISECWNAEALDPNAEIYDLLSFDDQLRNHDIKGSQDNDIYIHARTRVRDTRIRNYKEEIVLQQLMPKQEIRQQIARHDVSNMIGLHVRTEGGNVNTDNPWDAAEHFSEREFEHIDKWRKYSQLDTFFDELDRIILEEPDVRFFLCTDRPEHYKSFLNRYGRERIYHIPRKHFDRSQKQIETALIDLYLLSQTRYILGSSYSSFSDVAAILGTSRILRAGEDF